MSVAKSKSIYFLEYRFSSVQLLSRVYSLWPHELQHARPPCPSPTPGVYPNSCPLSQWCHLTFSSFVVPFSSCLQSFPTSGSFQMSQLFTSGSQNIGVSASTSVLPMNTQDCLLHHSSKASILQHSACFIVQLSHPYMTTGKTIALTRRTFVDKVMSLLFNILSRLVITFLPRSKCFLISWLQSPSAVIFGDEENKVSHCFHCFPIYLPWSDGTRCHALCFLLSFKPTFSLSSFTFIKRLFSSSLSAIRVVSSAYLRLLIFLLAILIPACASSSPAFLWWQFLKTILMTNNKKCLFEYSFPRNTLLK